MQTVIKTEKKKQFDGLPLVILVFCAVLSSPLVYFLIHLMLGNEELFLFTLINKADRIA